jgi:hypothetical protein
VITFARCAIGGSLARGYAGSVWNLGVGVVRAKGNETKIAKEKTVSRVNRKRPQLILLHSRFRIDARSKCAQWGMIGEHMSTPHVL